MGDSLWERQNQRWFCLSLLRRRAASAGYGRVRWDSVGPGPSLRHVLTSNGEAGRYGVAVAGLVTSVRLDPAGLVRWWLVPSLGAGWGCWDQGRRRDTVAADRACPVGTVSPGLRWHDWSHRLGRAGTGAGSV